MDSTSGELHSPARERRVLSFVNLDGGPAMQVCSEAGLSVDAFYDPEAATLFGVAQELHRSGHLYAGGEILGEEAVERRKVVKWPAFVELTKPIPEYGVMVAELPGLCRELIRLKRHRDLKRSSELLADALRVGDQEAVTATIAKIQTSEHATKPRATWQQVGGVEIDRAEAIIAGREDPDVRSIPWPWRCFDVDFRPFRRGEQVVVAGYTSNGKSSMLRQLLMSAAKAGYNCAMVSLEVPAADIFNLMAAAESGQPWSRLKGLHPADQKEFVGGQRRVRGYPIETIDDTHSLGAILAWLRNQHARRFLDVIAIDYLGLVSECTPQRGQTKAAAVGEVAAAFKRLATELGCVVYLAVQINRSPTSDGNRPPKLSDLKDSGDIEAHADRVLLLYRPNTDRTTGMEQNVHDALSDRARFYMELFQEKGRNAGTGMSSLWLRRELARFELIG